MRIRSATPNDLDATVELFRDASRWLASKGSDQWQRPPRIAQIRHDIEHGNVFVVEDEDGTTVGTFTVDTFADPTFWTAEDDPTSALYIHRMIVARTHAGREIGEQMTRWAEKFAGALGYKWLRLDAWRSNDALLGYYRSRGWQYLRTVHAPGRQSGALFQRPTANVAARRAS